MARAPEAPIPPQPPAVIPPPPPQAPAKPAPFMHVQRTERPPIDPDLPADTPLEPGTANARGRTPAERIAASEAALGPALGTLKREGEVAGKANFIAAARRAAQAAANEGVVEGTRAEEHKTEQTPTSLIGRFLANRRRALMVGVTALLVLYGTMQIVGMMGGSNPPEAPPRVAPSQTQAPEARKVAAAAPAAVPAVAVPAAAPAAEPAPSRQAEPLIAPTPTASLIAPTPVAHGGEPACTRFSRRRRHRCGQAAAQHRGTCSPDGTCRRAGGRQASRRDRRAGLRAAAAAGNPAAEYEIGVRYSEGRGVRANLELAAQWFERAAKQGLAPALYRLGSLYEKGQGVKKDLEQGPPALSASPPTRATPRPCTILRCSTPRASTASPTTTRAAQWFRKAAARGVADSQYNLGILYARGIGVEQNLAESYKWFALAAQQGDQDAGKKRDDVAARLDQQSLVAARLAMQTFAAEPPARGGHEGQGSRRRLGSRNPCGAGQARRDRAPQDRSRPEAAGAASVPWPDHALDSLHWSQFARTGASADRRGQAFAGETPRAARLRSR